VLLRYDPGVLLSAIGRYLPSLASGGTDAMKLTGPFSKVCGACVLCVQADSEIAPNATARVSSKPVRGAAAVPC
jgi:hypothetical protein